MRIRNSLWARLVQHEVTDQDAVVASIRQAMLNAIDELGSPAVRTLEDKVNNASDVTALWNVRPDLLTAIAAEHGEEVARNQVNRITNLFRLY